MGLAEQAEARGLRPGSRILQLEEVRPSAEVRALLWVGDRAARSFACAVCGIADDVLMGLQETVLPTRHAPGLTQSDLTDRSLGRVLRERHGLAAAWADLTIEAVVADTSNSGHLEVAPGDPPAVDLGELLVDGRPLERTVGWFPGSRYSYQLRQGGASDG